MEFAPRGAVGVQARAARAVLAALAFGGSRAIAAADPARHPPAFDSASAFAGATVAGTAGGIEEQPLAAIRPPRKTLFTIVAPEDSGVRTENSTTIRRFGAAFARV